MGRSFARFLNALWTKKGAFHAGLANAESNWNGGSRMVIVKPIGTFF